LGETEGLHPGSAGYTRRSLSAAGVPEGFRPDLARRRGFYVDLFGASLTLIPHERWLATGRRLLHTHRRSIVTTAVVTMAGFAVTAFGIAPMAPDASLLPQRLLTQEVPAEPLAAQIEALAQHDLQLWRSDVLRGAESAESLLRRLGVVDPAAAAFLRNDPQARRLLAGRTRMVQARIGPAGELQQLIGRMGADNAELLKTHFVRISVTLDQGIWLSRSELAPLASTVRMASGTIRSSLFAATDELRLPDTVAVQLADIFSGDIDFHRELRRGDSFHLVYEALSADGQPVAWNEGAGRVLAAEFANKGRVHHALWFDGVAGGKGGYFGLDGSSRRRAFLASPLEFSRVTSGFANRLHPIFNQWRKHLGVDYSAPIGTAVRTVGDGVVDFAGWQNGYGKVVEVRHSNDRSTLYAHLNTLRVRKGERVSQGQHIGDVGRTGWSTGPHLHFEFRVAGVHHDPLQVARAVEPVQLDAAAKARFADKSQALQVKLDLAETLGGARARFE
jgi:murein DD-endopeptidase MepM/ murein hydrolase activator NlpD